MLSPYWEELPSGVLISKVQNCEYCPTEFTIELRKQGSSDLTAETFEVVVRRWRDLGEGRSVTDPKWWTHLDSRYTVSDIFAGVRRDYEAGLGSGVGENKLCELGSIKSQYEEVMICRSWLGNLVCNLGRLAAHVLWRKWGELVSEPRHM